MERKQKTIQAHNIHITLSSLIFLFREVQMGGYEKFGFNSRKY